MKAGIIPRVKGGLVFSEQVQFAGGMDGPIGNGDIYYVDSTNGSDTNTGKTPGTALATIAAAENKCTANQNDTVKILGGAAGNNLAALLTWDKNYTHLVGVAPPTRVAQRARIFSDSTTKTTLMNITATGCLFENFYIFNGGDDATELTNVQVTGGRNYFRNVHFAGMGHATPAAQAGASSLKLDGAEENTFVGCTIGVDTTVRGAANAQLLVDGTALRNIFDGCLFLSAATLTTPLMVKFADSTAGDRFTLFNDCLFYHFCANHAATLEAAFSLPATNATFDVILNNCACVGIDDWSADNRTNLWITNAAPTAGTSGLGVNPTA